MSQRIFIIITFLALIIGALGPASQSVQAQNSLTGIIGVSWSPDGTMIAAGGVNGLLRVWNAETGQVVANFPVLNTSIMAIDWKPNSKWLASSGEDNIVRIWNVNDSAFPVGQQIASFQGHLDKPMSLSWSPDGTRLASASIYEQYNLKIWDVVNFQPQALLQRSVSNILKVDWSPNNDYLAFATVIGIIVLPSTLNIPSNTQVTNYRLGPNSSMYSVAWSPSGTMIAGGGDNGIVYIWNSSSGQQLKTLSGHSGVVNSISWNSNEVSVATSSSDNTVRVWDTNSSYQLISYANPKDVGTTSISWSPDGTKLVYGSSSIEPVIMPFPGLPSVTPTRLSASLSTSGIILNWVHNSSDETNFRIERSTSESSGWSEIGTTVANVTSFTDSISNPSTTYYYRVRAYRDTDDTFSEYSEVASILTAPASPNSLSGASLPLGQVRLTWTDVSSDETNFRIERLPEGGIGGMVEWEEIGVVGANQTTYTDNLGCNHLGTYRIRAFRASDGAFSPYSETIEVHSDGCGPDRLALFNTVHTHNRRFTDLPGTTYNDYWLNSPVASGQWVMGDWDGNGVDTPAVFNQDSNTFAFTNDTGATGTWVSMTLTVDGVPVAGRFNGNRANDCLGVVDDVPFGSDTAFALWFVCDYTNLTPNIGELGYQWLGAPLANSAGFSSQGLHQFATGDFNTDGVDTVVVRRGVYIAYGNIAPTTQVADLNLAQYFGNPYNGQYGGLYGQLVAGDWNYDGIDTFGYFYEDGNFYWRNHLEWNQPISGSALISQPYGAYVLPTTWRN